MKKKDFKYVYEVRYASGIIRTNGRDNQIVFSNKELKENDFIVVEHIDCGAFIGRVWEDITNDYDKDELTAEYIYVQDIDLSNWIAKYDKKKRKEELKLQMESKARELDKKKKLEYYAQMDEEFNKLYSEYTELEDIEEDYEND